MRKLTGIVLVLVLTLPILPLCAQQESEDKNKSSIEEETSAYSSQYCINYFLFQVFTFK